MTRNFEAKPAARAQVPLLIGLMGPSGGGKTFSALRLATGIQAVTGKDIFYVDTEAKRALHYADMFKFQHVPFDAPFGALDYLEVLDYCAKKGAGVVVVDSMSHEHEGPGGLLDTHDKELDRLGGADYAKRERVKMLAWQKPKANRRKLINGLLQMNANFIFCFRAKETAKPVKKDGKSTVENMGFMPIAGDEFLFEMTVNCLLLPKAGGVPTWRSDNIGERLMMKLPKQFEGIFQKEQPLSEDIGRQLAEWAKGGAAVSTRGMSGSDKAASSSSSPDVSTGEAADDVLADPLMKQVDDALAEAAKNGGAALRAEWTELVPAYQAKLKGRLDTVHKPAAVKADKANAHD